MLDGQPAILSWGKGDDGLLSLVTTATKSKIGYRKSFFFFLTTNVQFGFNFKIRYTVNSVIFFFFF